MLFGVEKIAMIAADIVQFPYSTKYKQNKKIKKKRNNHKNL